MMNNIDRTDKRFPPAVAGYQDILLLSGIIQPVYLTRMKIYAKNRAGKVVRLAQSSVPVNLLVRIGYTNAPALVRASFWSIRPA